MESSPSSDVTRWLHEWSAGDPSAADRLLPVIYRELHRLAGGYLSRERQGHTLQATALVNEAWLRLADQSASWQNRAHFLGVAAVSATLGVSEKTVKRDWAAAKAWLQRELGSEGR